MESTLGNHLKRKIACAVVIYGARLSDCEVYNTLIGDGMGDIDCLLVFDNSPERYDEDLRLPDGCVYRYFWNPSNPGVSADYNAAARFAADNGYDWLLLLDQDTSFPKNALSVYKEGWKSYPDGQIFAPKHRIADGRYISPSRVFRSLPRSVAVGVYDLYKYDVINSGLLVSVDKFIKAGGYDEAVGLDFSDFQFIERIRKIVPSVIVLDIECCQDFSNAEPDRTKLLARFSKFCECAAAYRSDSLRGKAKIAYLVLRHTVALALRCRTLSVFYTLVKALNNRNSKI